MPNPSVKRIRTGPKQAPRPPLSMPGDEEHNEIARKLAERPNNPANLPPNRRTNPARGFGRLPAGGE